MKRTLCIAIDLGKKFGVVATDLPKRTERYTFYGEKFTTDLHIVGKELLYNFRNPTHIQIITSKTIYRNHITTWRLGMYWGMFIQHIRKRFHKAEIEYYEFFENEIYREVFNTKHIPQRQEKKMLTMEKFHEKNEDIADAELVLAYWLKKYK